MNEQEQIVAIAEACGWKQVTEHSHGESWQEWRNDKYPFRSNCPDYLHDLHAMHEALVTMTDNEWKVFMDFLCIVTGHEKTVLWFYKQSNVVIEMFKATAPQRAEAFLRTIGKWRDDERSTK